VGLAHRSPSSARAGPAHASIATARPAASFLMLSSPRSLACGAILASRPAAAMPAADGGEMRRPAVEAPGEAPVGAAVKAAVKAAGAAHDGAVAQGREAVRAAAVRALMTEGDGPAGAPGRKPRRGADRRGAGEARRHRGGAGVAEAGGDRRIDIADGAAMHRVVHPHAAGKGDVAAGEN